MISFGRRQLSVSSAAAQSARQTSPAALWFWCLLNRLVLPEDLGDLLLGRQFIQTVQPEVGQESFGRPVDQGIARALFPSRDLDQLLFEQSLDRVRGVDIAQGRDLGQGNRLMVGDDGQRLQGSRGQLALAVDLEKPSHPGVEFGSGGEDVAPAALDDDDAAFGGRGALEEILEGLLDLGRRMVA